MLLYWKSVTILYVQCQKENLLYLFTVITQKHTVQHSTVIQKFHKIGFSTAALKWFVSYLGNRLQYVQVNDFKSATKPCHFGVLQGSLLGPLLFNLYVNDLQDIDPCWSCKYISIPRWYHTIETLQNLTYSTNYPKQSKASEQSKCLVKKR